MIIKPFFSFSGGGEPTFFLFLFRLPPSLLLTLPYPPIHLQTRHLASWYAPPPPSPLHVSDVWCVWGWCALCGHLFCLRPCAFFHNDMERFFPDAFFVVAFCTVFFFVIGRVGDYVWSNGACMFYPVPKRVSPL